MVYAIRTENLSKQYPGTLANDKVNLKVHNNTIHAIVGENGAGKSTLVSQLFGIVRRTSGKIYINDIEVDFAGAQDAISAGIGMVHQHFRLIDNLTVGENIILGNEPGKKRYLDRKKAYEKINELSKKFGLNIDPTELVEDISIGQKQKTEIMRALYVGSDILILDEPTAVLTPQEIDELEIIVKKLKMLGKTIIIITHKLEEVMNFTDYITVMRLGKQVADLKTSETNPKEITKKMVGRSVTLGGNKDYTMEVSNLNVLNVEKISYTNPQGKRLKNISFEVKAGEILGIAGVDGSGQTELINIIAGIIKQESGTIEMNQKNIDSLTVRERRNNSFGFIPQDRHHEGLLLDFPIDQNLMLGFEDNPSLKTKLGFLNWKKIKGSALELIQKYDIRTPNEKLNVGSLSGGNQQKIIIARETNKNPNFVLATQPTRGLDVGAIEFVHEVLTNLRNNNKGVLVVSFELDELLDLCDRIMVMCHGEVIGILSHDDFDKEKIGLLMVGQKD